MTQLTYDSKDLNKKRLFLTGGQGFIGQALQELLKNDYDIYAPTMEELDITNFKWVREYLSKLNPHFVIHLAARTEVEKSFYDPIDFQLVNYNATANLIESLKDCSNLELFVFSSTMETYGAVPKNDWRPFTEETKQFPNAPYAVAKIACEYYLEYAKRSYNFPYCILRQTNTYGRKDNDFFVVEQIITQMLKNKEEINLGYREPYRNFLYIDDLLELYRVVLRNVDLSKGEIFCTGSHDRAIRIEVLANMIASKLDWHGKIRWGTKPIRVGEIYYLDSLYEKAERILGWKPEISLNKGLELTISYWRNKLGYN